jgi:hypothetical protein
MVPPVPPAARPAAPGGDRDASPRGSAAWDRARGLRPWLTPETPSRSPSSCALARAVEHARRHLVDGEWARCVVTNGPAYIHAKDEQEDAVVDCVTFAAGLAARRHLADGARLQVIAKGTFYLPRGRLPVIDRVDPGSRGAARGLSASGSASPKRGSSRASASARSRTSRGSSPS